MAAPEKIIPTCDEVLALFADEARMAPSSRPLTIGEIARYVSSDYPGSNWDDPYKNMHRTALLHLVREMVDGGTLVVRTGEEWRRAGKTFYDQRGIVRYWTTPKLAEKWTRQLQEEEESSEKKELQKQADAYAKGLLVERHREEYDGLVAEYFAELKKEQQP